MGPMVNCSLLFSRRMLYSRSSPVRRAGEGFCIATGHFEDAKEKSRGGSSRTFAAFEKYVSSSIAVACKLVDDKVFIHFDRYRKTSL